MATRWKTGSPYKSVIRSDRHRDAFTPPHRAEPCRCRVQPCCCQHMNRLREISSARDSRSETPTHYPALSASHHARVPSTGLACRRLQRRSQPYDPWFAPEPAVGLRPMTGPQSPMEHFLHTPGAYARRREARERILCRHGGDSSSDDTCAPDRFIACKSSCRLRGGPSAVGHYQRYQRRGRSDWWRIWAAPGIYS